MRKTSLSIALLFCTSFFLFSQEKDSLITEVMITTPIKSETFEPNTFKRNAVFLELGGNAFLYSLNYERLNKISENIKLSYGTGLEFIRMELPHHTGISRSKKSNLLIITPAINFLFGKNKYYFEIGTSTALLYHLPVNQTFRLGYRYQGDKVIFRIGFTPIFEFPSDGKFDYEYFWAGVSFGHTF